MIKYIKPFFKLYLFLLFFFVTIQQINSQNKKITDAVNYINDLINDSSEVSISDNNIAFNRYNKGKRVDSQVINVKNVSEVFVSNHLSVNLNCTDSRECVSQFRLSAYGPETKSRKYLFIPVENYDVAEKISNALRFIIDEAKKSYVDNDPYASYSSKKSANVYDLKIGMNKEEVFDLINTTPKLEVKERDYEVYRIAIRETIYFLYFYSSKLERVDKGVRNPDAIIKLSD